MIGGIDRRERSGRQRLADHKVPRQIIVVPELPMTASGKIAKAVLREQAKDAV